MVTLEALRAGAQDVLADAPVTFAYLFGSTATGTARPDSDVEVAVMVDVRVADDERLRLTLRLGNLLEQRLRTAVDLLALNDAPLRVIGRVLAERVVLYSADEVARVRYETTMRPLTFDFEHHARALDRELLAAHAERRR
jgi:uncharacterized protein